MNFVLVVTHAFGSHAKGDQITDPSLISQILASENSGYVVRIAAPAATKLEH